MPLSFLVPPMATLFMAPRPATAPNMFSIAPVPARGRLFPGTVELHRSRSAGVEQVLVSVTVKNGAVTLLHNRKPVSGIGKRGCRNALLTIARDDTIELAMDLAQGRASGTYSIEVI